MKKTLPVWLEDHKNKAKRAFESLGWPDAKNEAYKRLDLSFLKNFNTNQEPFSLEIRNSNSHGPAARLTEALKAQQKTVQENLASLVPARQGKFEALNLSSFGDGIFVHMLEGEKREEPIYGFFDGTSGKSNPAFFPRTLAVLAPRSKAIYVEEYRGDSTGLALWDHVSEFILGENACLTYIAINNLGPKFKSFVFESASLAANAKLQIFHLNLGSEVNRLEMRSNSWGTNSRLEILGAVLGQGSQHVSAWILNHHQATNTKSHILWKSALSGESKSSFLASVRIAKEAEGSETFQACHNLLLSRRAAAYPNPRLEILSNNVRAKHASTVGYLNPEEKFYLASRGLDERQAEKLMTLGFLAEPMKYLNPSLSQTLEKKLQEALYGNREDLLN